MTEDEMVGWHQWLNGHEFEQAPGDGEGQWSLVCCSPWGCKESDTTEQQNNKDFSGGSDGKESACNARDLGSIPGWERSPGVGNGNPLQYSRLENSMDRVAWQGTVHRVTKESDTTERLCTNDPVILLYIWSFILKNVWFKNLSISEIPLRSKWDFTI